MKNKIVFNQDGFLESLKLNETEFIVSGNKESIFKVQLRDFIGSPFMLESCDFKEVEVSENDDTLQVVYSNCPRLPGTLVFVYAIIGENSIDWQIRVEIESKDYRLEFADYPRLVVKYSEDTKLLLPSKMAVNI